MATQIKITVINHASLCARELSRFTSPLWLVREKNGADVLLTDVLPDALEASDQVNGRFIEGYESGEKIDRYKGQALEALTDLVLLGT